MEAVPLSRVEDLKALFSVHYTAASHSSSMAKPNYSFEKRQREIAKKKKQDEKDAKKRAEREAAKAAATPPPDTIK